MQVYNNFRVINYDIPRGDIELAWYDDTKPLAGQHILTLNHKIPLEAELNNWTRADFLTWFINEVEDVADVPQWAKDEAAKTRIYNKLIPEILP